MILAVDIDGVLADTLLSTIERIYEEYAVSLEKNDINRYDYTFQDIGVSELVKEYVYEPDFIMNLPVIKDASETIKMLSYEHVITIVTHRPSKTFIETFRWLSQNKIDFFGFTCMDKDRKKTEASFDVLIDDSVQNVLDVVEDGRIGILFNQPYNQGRESLNRYIRNGHVYVADNWKEVRKAISEIEDT